MPQKCWLGHRTEWVVGAGPCSYNVLVLLALPHSYFSSQPEPSKDSVDIFVELSLYVIRREKFTACESGKVIWKGHMFRPYIQV
jgi:hypothetical protein